MWTEEVKAAHHTTPLTNWYKHSFPRTIMDRPQPGTTLTTTQSTPNKRRQTTTAAHPSPSHQCHTPACYCYLLFTYRRKLQKPKPKLKLWCKTTRRSKITKHFATAINITTHLSYFHSCAYSSSSVSVLLMKRCWMYETESEMKTESWRFHSNRSLVPTFCQPVWLFLPYPV